MIKSMTGYGRAEITDEQKRIVIEVKAVNQRFLDFNIRMPRRFICLEDKVRKTIQERVFRGHIDVFITVESVGSQTKNIKVDKALAQAYYREISELQEELGIARSLDIKGLISLPDVFKVEEPEEDTDLFWQEYLQPALESAVDALVKMRELEGQKLLQDIKGNLRNIEEGREKIAFLAPGVVTEYQERLENKLKDMLSDTEIDSSRILTETAIFASKVDINEELVRLDSHLHQFEACLTKDEPIGRKLDFINQEMAREINTIGSKANNQQITSLVVDLKGEAEKIKEQVQNIE